MGTIAAGVTSLLEGQEPPSPPSNVAIFIVYGALFALLVLQARGIVRSVVALRSGRIRRGRVGPWWRIGFSLVLSLVWALFVFVLVPKQLPRPRLPTDCQRGGGACLGRSQGGLDLRRPS
jgi:hypothetical protein